MDFLKKAVKEAKKAGTTAVNAVKDVRRPLPVALGRVVQGGIDSDEADCACVFVTPSCACVQAVDENNAASASAGRSSEDQDFEDEVQRFMTLNTALRNIASKVNAKILAVKAHSEASMYNIELLEATCELEFGEDSFWTNSAIALRSFNQQVDGKMNKSLQQLVQRDILDKIKAELETNQATKELMDARRAAKDLNKHAADAAVAKMQEIVRRRKMILAHCVTSLMSHEYNYYVRIAELARPLHQVAAECKSMLSDDGPAAQQSDETTADSRLSGSDAGACVGSHFWPWLAMWYYLPVYTEHRLLRPLDYRRDRDSHGVI